MRWVASSSAVTSSRARLQRVGQFQAGRGQAHAAQGVADRVQVQVQAGRADRHDAPLQSSPQQVRGAGKATQVEGIAGHVQQRKVIGAGVRYHVLVSHGRHVAGDGAFGGFRQRLLGLQFLYRPRTETWRRSPRTAGPA